MNFRILPVALTAIFLFAARMASQAEPTSAWEKSSGELAGMPDLGEAHTAVWTGSEVIVWGGYFVDGELNTGVGYIPATGVRTALPREDAPRPRMGHTAVLTGSEMIVWGQQNLWPWETPVAADGARYRSAVNAWTPVTTVGAPVAFRGQSAVWIGREMLVFGGFRQDNELRAFDTFSYRPWCDGLRITSTLLDARNLLSDSPASPASPTRSGIQKRWA